jgi:hypothetical protein
MVRTRRPSGTQINQPVPREESRKLERFSLRLPASISGLEPGDTIRNLMTGNISADGAFFLTSEPLPEGIRVLVELTLKRESGLGKASKVHVKGRVLRSQPDGMAVLFEKRVQMLSC